MSFVLFRLKQLVLNGKVWGINSEICGEGLEVVKIWNGVWGRGCDEAEISEEKRLFTECGQGIQERQFSEEVRAI